MTKVSVIIPIYRVEKFIERCVRSLLEQTLQEVEFIFVDDATPDKSIEILHTVCSKYPQRSQQIKIVTHQTNKGLPAARNTGLSVASGEYIFHCDSDDYMERNMLEELYGAAVENLADIVWCDWFLTFEQNERYMRQPSFTTPIEALRAMLDGRMKYNVWNKLVKRRLYIEHEIVFPTGHGMGEDMTMMMLFAYAEKVCYLPNAFYHYVKLNTGAFSQTYSKQHLIDLRYNTQRIIDFMQKTFGDELNQDLAFFKLDVKFPFLITNRRDRYNLWKELYPEANAYILQNKSVSARRRYLQWLAWKNQYWAVCLYYWVINKFVYGILYK